MTQNIREDDVKCRQRRGRVRTYPLVRQRGCPAGPWPQSCPRCQQPHCNIERHTHRQSIDTVQQSRNKAVTSMRQLAQVHSHTHQLRSLHCSTCSTCSTLHAGTWPLTRARWARRCTSTRSPRTATPSPARRACLCSRRAPCTFCPPAQHHNQQISTTNKAHTTSPLRSHQTQTQLACPACIEHRA